MPEEQNSSMIEKQFHFRKVISIGRTIREKQFHFRIQADRDNWHNLEEDSREPEKQNGGQSFGRVS